MPERKLIMVAVGLLALSGLNCRQAETIPPQKDIGMAEKTIEQVQQEHTEAWMAIPGVVGTAIGQREGKPCILVFTAANTERVRQKIPLAVDGYPVVVQYTGEIHAR